MTRSLCVLLKRDPLFSVLPVTQTVRKFKKKTQQTFMNYVFAFAWGHDRSHVHPACIGLNLCVNVPACVTFTAA